MKPKISICIPTYNGSAWIKETLASVFSQSFQDFEIIISDDHSTDNTVEIIRALGDSRIKIYQNRTNLGYGKNLEVLRNKASGKILFLLGQDDILLKNALLRTYEAFALDENIGAVTRPYHWFFAKDKNLPIRSVTPYEDGKDVVLSVFDSKKAVQKILESAGQLSGLAFRRTSLPSFHQETFTAHIYPLAQVSKTHKIVFLGNYTVAVRTVSSQTRFKKEIYKISPLKSWIDMFTTVYAQKKFARVKKVGIEQITTHFIGLFQIKNYGGYFYLLREIYYHIKYHWQNLFDPRFWAICCLCLLVPRRPLILLVDWYKNIINAKLLENEQI